MTRINSGIPPRMLPGLQLLAEHREIKRIPNLVASGKANLDDIPKQFTLGTGHVKFFYDKLGYLFERYKELHYECLRRDYDVMDFCGAWDAPTIPNNTFSDWEPTPEAVTLILERFREKGIQLLPYEI